MAPGTTGKGQATGKDSKLKLFRVRVSTYRTDDLVANELAQDDTAAEAECGVRGTVAQFHREAKQLPNLEARQCRLARSRRNRSGLALRARTRLKSLAYSSHQMVYQPKKGLLAAYRRQELACPTSTLA